MTFNWNDSYSLQDFLDEFHGVTIIDTRISKMNDDDDETNYQVDNENDDEKSAKQSDDDQEKNGGYTKVWDKLTIEYMVEYINHMRTI